jgi:hypothetical protein
VQSDIEHCLGQYLHRKASGKRMWTRVYLARFQSEYASIEGRKVVWCDVDQMCKVDGRVCRAAASFVHHSAHRLTGKTPSGRAGLAA